MDLGLIGQAVGMFAATNVDDIVILALFFGQAVGHRGGARLLPTTVIPYLGLLPLALGIRAAWRA